MLGDEYLRADRRCWDGPREQTIGTAAERRPSIRGTPLQDTNSDKTTGTDVPASKQGREEAGDAAKSRESRRVISILWTQNHHLVLSYIRSVVIDFHLADDVLQETAASVAEAFDDYDQSQPFLPWALGIARNKVLVALRSRSRDRCVFDQELVNQLSITHAKLDPNISEAQFALSECLGHLQQRALKLLELRYVRDLSGAAMAKATGMTAGAVGVSLHRIRKSLKRCVDQKLREQLAEGGYR